MTKREFKVGDKVKVYGAVMLHCEDRRPFLRGCRCEVTDILKCVADGDELYVRILSAGFDQGKRASAHVNQCVRLVPRKRREWWIEDRGLRDQMRVWQYNPTSTRPDVDFSQSQIIHVREVPKKVRK